MEHIRRKTRQVNAGGVLIGGNAPLSVQTMSKAPAENVEKTMKQINDAADAGCEIIRCAIPTVKNIDNFAAVVNQSPLPVIADIHFDCRIAIGAIEAGAAKIRINPGNMGDWGNITRVLDTARNKGVPIRIGVNSGSVRHLDKAAGRSTEELLVEQALNYAQRFEELNFHDIVLSLKTTDALSTIKVNREVASKCNYPLHIGVTEAGLEEEALLKSAIGIGGLLADGIGDTIRLSFTGEPVREVIAGKALLRAAGLLKDQPDLVSCPTCGRCRINDLPSLASKVREKLKQIKKPLTIAVMGCEVNGPGEAASADFGIAGAGGQFLLFSKGKKLGKVPAEKAIDALFELISKD